MDDPNPKLPTPSEPLFLDSQIKAWEQGQSHNTDGLNSAERELANWLRATWESLPPETRGTLPAMIAGYSIERELGRGGFGIVYLGQNEQGHRAAIKQPLMQALISVSTRRRFLREGELGARLVHPCIVPVLSTGEEAGIPYIVSEFVEGQTLAQWLQEPKNSQLSIAVALDLMIQIASGIAHAHQRGILHRDIKPENILLDRYGQKPQLTDFGLGRAIEEDDSLSASHAIIGTSSFMAPEQAAGQRNDVDVRSEVWSLGVLLYRLLTGRLPFEAKNPAAVLVEILGSPVKALRDIRRGITRDLEAVCLKCLKIDRRERYESVDRLIEDLQRVQKGEPTNARPRSRISATIALARRYPTRTLFVGVMLLLLSVGPAVLVSMSNLRKELDITEQTKKIIQESAVKDRQNALFNELSSTVRQRIAQKPTGWINKNLKDFETLAQMPQWDSDGFELRSLWFETLASEDWEPIPWEVPGGHFENSAVSPDGKLFAIHQTRGNFFTGIETYLYDAETLELKATFRSKCKPVASNVKFKNPPDGGRGLVFSADSKTLYSATRSGWVYARGIDGSDRGSFKAFDEFIGEIDISPDGSAIYVTSRYSGQLKSFSTDGSYRLLAKKTNPDTTDTEEVQTTILVSPHSNHLNFYHSVDGFMRLNPKTLTPEKLPANWTERIQELSSIIPTKSTYLPQYNWVMSSRKNSLNFIDSDALSVTDRDYEISSKINFLSLNSIASAGDGRSIAISQNERLLIWDLTKREVIGQFATTENAGEFRFIQNGEVLLALGNRPLAFQRRRSDHFRALASTPMVINRFASIDSDEQLITISNPSTHTANARCILWDRRSGNDLNHVFSQQAMRIDDDITMAPDQKHVLFSLGGIFLHRSGWNPTSNYGVEYGPTGAASSKVRAFMPDGESFWAIDGNRLRHVSFKDIKRLNQSEDIRLSSVDERYHCLVYAHGRLIAARGTGQLDLFEAATGKFEKTINFGDKLILMITEFADGRLLMSDTFGNIRIVDPNSSRVISIPSPHKGRVVAIAIHPNQQTIFTGGADGQMILWKSDANGVWRQHMRLPMSRHGVRQAEFATNGEELYILPERSHHVQVWNLKGFCE